MFNRFFTMNLRHFRHLAFPLSVLIRAAFYVANIHLWLNLFCGAVFAQNKPITLYVSAMDAPRNILHAKLHIPAQPGPLILVYPKWIPGEHGPTGPITDLAGLKMSA